MRRTQNYLKHAKDDPDAEHTIEPQDTAALLMQAVMNMASLGRMLTITQSTFQLWFIAGMLDELPDLDATVRSATVKMFKNLSRRTLAYRLSVGRRILAEERRRT